MISTIDAKAVHEQQESYSKQLEEQGMDIGLTVANAFIESIRDLGYKSTGTAANENIDNAAEAGAENVHIVFGYPDNSRKPNQLAIADDGIGMVPAMTRASALWGGTHRHGSRSLFGRYGYGLPSSAVSQGRAFTVYSRPDNGSFFALRIDLDEIAEGKHLAERMLRVPQPEEATLPTFVTSYADNNFPGGSAALRTVVVWEKLDRLEFRQSEKLENHLLETIGVTYRNQLRSQNIAVNGKTVEPVDPLFLTEGARFYDVDDERAEPFEPIVFDVRNQETRETLGTIKVRFSVLPPGFARIDKEKKATSKNANPRFRVMGQHNGLIVLRAGRQIDVVSRGLPTTFGNNDRYVKVEIDFPPSLDELFGVTTHKQQITLSGRVIQLLDENQVWKTLEKMRARSRELDADFKSAWGAPGPSDDDEPMKRPSESAMEDASQLDAGVPPSERRTQQADEGREKVVDELVDKGVPRADAETIVETVEKDRPFRVEMESNPEGPFYRVDLRGTQVVLLINTKHRFYTDVYGAVQGAEGARMRQALEVVLFVIGKCEIDADEARALFYKSERNEWSKRMNTALAKLDAYVELAPDEESEIDEVVSEHDAKVAGGASAKD